MKNKFIKKSIITSSILGTAVVASPVILTSCSVLDKNNQNIEDSSTWKTITSIDFVNNLFKRDYIDNDGNKKSSFWLDSKDFHAFNSTNKDFATLHRKIIIDRKSFIENDLIKINNFVPVDSKFTKIENGEKQSYLKRNNDSSSLNNVKKLINGINFVNSNNNSNNSAIQSGISISGANLNLDEISKEVDITIQVSFIDKVVDNKKITLDNSEQYSIELILIPKNEFKWNVDNKEDYKTPLIITINDYVDKIGLFPKLNKSNILFPSNKESNTRNNVQEIHGVHGKNAHKLDIKTPNDFIEKMNKILGLSISNKSTENDTLNILIPNKISTINFLKESKIISKDNEDQSYNFVSNNGDFSLIYSTFLWDNFLNAAKFNRLNLYLTKLYSTSTIDSYKREKIDSIINLTIELNDSPSDEFGLLMDIDNIIEGKNYNGIDRPKIKLSLRLQNY